MFERPLNVGREVFKLCSASSEKYGPWKLSGLKDNVAERHVATDCSSGDSIGIGEWFSIKHRTSAGVVCDVFAGNRIEYA